MAVAGDIDDTGRTRRQELLHDEIREEEGTHVACCELTLESVFGFGILAGHDTGVIHEHIDLRYIVPATDSGSGLFDPPQRLKIELQGACLHLWVDLRYGVRCSLVLSGVRLARIRSFGSATAIFSTKKAPRPPGDTPVVRMTLPLMTLAYSFTSTSAVVLVS